MPRYKIGVVLSLVVVSFVVVQTAFAQNESIRVTGLVTDAYGAVIPNAAIIAESKKKPKLYAETSSDGEYTLNLKPGIYKITVKKQSFTSFVIHGYQVPYSGSMKLDVSLVCRNCHEIID